MKVQFFSELHLEDLQRYVNEFITDKKVLNIAFTTQPMYDMFEVGD